MVLERQRVVPLTRIRFLLAEQIGNQKGAIRFQVKAQLELAHHINDEQALVFGIAPVLEDAVEHRSLQHALVLRHQRIVIEDAVDAKGGEQIELAIPHDLLPILNRYPRVLKLR